MKKITSFVFVLVAGTTLSTVFAANGFCRRCQEIRDERLRNPERQYEYYEDYLEENGGRKTAISREGQDQNDLLTPEKKDSLKKRQPKQKYNR